MRLRKNNLDGTITFTKTSPYNSKNQYLHWNILLIHSYNIQSANLYKLPARLGVTSAGNTPDLQFALFGVAPLRGSQLDGHAGPVAVADGVLHQRQRRPALKRRQDHELGVAVHVLLCGDSGHDTDAAGSGRAGGGGGGRFERSGSPIN